MIPEVVVPHLLNKIALRKGVSIEFRDEAEQSKAVLNCPFTGQKLEELQEIKASLRSFTIFGGAETPNRNGWKSYRVNDWLGDTANELVFGWTGGSHPHFDGCFVFGESLSGGPDYLAVDLHEDRLGWIVVVWYEFSWEDASYPVVAHSFSEWLEKTVESGPDVRYWERADFVDLGPAIPDDICYRPPNSR